jgi:hypothetical protein
VNWNPRLWNWDVLLERIGAVLMAGAVVCLFIWPVKTAAVLGSIGVFAAVVHKAIPLLQKLADYTVTRADNNALLWLTPRLERLIGALDLLRRMPRITMGPSLRTQPLASATGRPTMPPISAPPGPPIATLRPWPTVPTIPTEPLVTPPSKEPTP